jgi:hypothetical protein
MNVAMSPHSVARVRDEAEGAFHGAAPEIVVPSTAVRAYLRTFGAIAIVAYADGSIGCTKDIGRPLKSKPVAVWWAPNAGLAVEVVRQCEAEHHTDITSVAYGLGVRLTPNDVAIANAERALATLDARIKEAQQRGYMKVFNKRYAHLRRQARSQGASFMSYGVAVHRLKQELARCLAGKVDGSVVERALGVAPEATQPSTAIRW